LIPQAFHKFSTDKPEVFHRGNEVFHRGERSTGIMGYWGTVEIGRHLEVIQLKNHEEL
jgi:hypothetical protein